MKRVLALIVVCAASAWVLWSHETLTTTVLFDREIVRILDKHCVMCHTANGPSFPLETYEQTWLEKRKIHASTIARHMPPWDAVPGYGQFINENNLTLRETQFIVSWVEGLGPRNSGVVFTNTADPGAAQSQEVRAHADFGHWQLGQPQLTRQLAANTIEPQQSVIKRTAIDPGLTSERRLRALEFMPSDRRVVRAAFFTIQETGQWIGSWTPWHGFVNLPKGVAYRLPARSHIVAEIHYQGAQERIVEHGTLGLFFADQPSPDMVSDLVLQAPSPAQPGTKSVRLRATAKLAADTYALALRPDLHPGMKSIEVSARRPDGGTNVLLFAKDLRLDWPTPYIFKDPVALPKGTELTVTAYYASAASVPHSGALRLTVSKY
ncbi:MAG TPA: hypothetical protein VN841_28995 [Bryobacteraceae bacterium]|nr:hypothetical protein [Bryobacteraceae bacterium]